MGTSRLLDEQREEQQFDTLANYLGISREEFDSLDPEIESTDSDFTMIVRFSDDAPEEILEKIGDLAPGKRAVSFPLWLFDSDEQWANEEIPDDPHSVYMNSHYHVADMLAEYGEKGTGVLRHSAPLLTRMIFAQQVSALEAYLCDTLLNEVTRSNEARDRLLKEDKELKDARVPLLEIAMKPDIVNEWVRKHLQGILYHNLQKVAVLYKIALRLEIWPDSETKEIMHKAVRYRHDCVHRNGRNLEGEELTFLNQQYVAEILGTMLKLVNHIETQLPL
jgi:hypothetical protein